MTATAEPTTARSEAERAELLAIAQEAFIWGSPLVQFGEYRRSHANDYFPLNRFNSLLKIIGNDFNPSQEILYSFIDFDLHEGPQVLRLPDHGEGRYFSVHLVDPFFNAFAYVGSRTYGHGGGDFVLVGPDWIGDLPEGLTVVRTPSNRITGYGRTGVQSSDDLDKAKSIVMGYEVTSLARYPEGFKGPHLGLNGLWFPNYRGDKQGTLFWDKLGTELEATPIPEDEQHLTERFARIGLEPGSRPREHADPELRAILKEGIVTGQAKIDSFSGLTTKNGWGATLGVGKRIKDPVLRAYLQRDGGGFHDNQECVQFRCATGPDGLPLSGEKKYVLRFPPGGLPPVRAFWSLILIDANGIPVANELNRHAVGTLMPDMSYGAAGALTLQIQADRPGASDGAMWLPAARENFSLMVRTYVPDESIVAGEWFPPALEILG